MENKYLTKLAELVELEKEAGYNKAFFAAKRAAKKAARLGKAVEESGFNPSTAAKENISKIIQQRDFAMRLADADKKAYNELSDQAFAKQRAMHIDHANEVSTLHAAQRAKEMEHDKALYEMRKQHRDHLFNRTLGVAAGTAALTSAGAYGVHKLNNRNQ